MRNLTIYIAFAMAISGCASQQNVDLLNTTARAESTSINVRAATSFADVVAKKDEKILKESKLPILSSRTVAVRRRLPDVFANEYFYNPQGERRLIDVVKALSSDTGLVITARDDVYNPTATKISSTDSNGQIDAAAVSLANDVRTETNLQVADRVKLPAGSRYSGSVEGFLDYVSSILNVSWQYLHDEDRVLFTRYIERSYQLQVPPKSNAEGGDTNIWKDTQETIEGLLSQGGSVKVNQEAGLISVVDTRDVQQMVAEHITKVNKSLARSVTFQVEVLSVSLTDSDNAGFDFSFIHEGNRDKIDLNGGGVSIPGSVGLVASVTSGPFNGSKLIQQNLATKGEVTTSLSRVVRTMNNQAATVNQIRVIPVISSYTPPTTNGGVTTPGGVATTDIEVGFKMKITPAIMSNGQNIVVALDLETSGIDEIIDIPIGDEGQLVQSARRTTRTYAHSFPASNADTIVISGFYDRSNEFTQKAASTSWLSWLFGSKNDSANRTYYVVLLTPDISNGTGTI